MTTWNNILQELKDVPADRLEDVYAIVHSLRNDTKTTSAKQKQILSFIGCFNDMSQDDYDDFTNETKRTRSLLFERDIDI